MAYRKRTSIGILVALLCALVPVAIMALVAWRVSVQNMQTRLETMAQLLITREELTVEQTSSILNQLSWPICRLAATSILG